MIEVKRRKYQRSQLPVCVAQMLVIAVSVHAVCDTLLLLYHTDYICHVNLVLLVVRLQIGKHLEFHVDTLLLDSDCSV